MTSIPCPRKLFHAISGHPKGPVPPSLLPAVMESPITTTVHGGPGGRSPGSAVAVGLLITHSRTVSAVRAVATMNRLRDTPASCQTPLQQSAHPDLPANFPSAVTAGHAVALRK